MHPKTIVKLWLSLTFFNLRLPLSLEKTFSMILTIKPFTCIPSLSLIKDQDSVFACLALFKVSQVDLLDFWIFSVTEHGDKTCSSRFIVNFTSMIERSISQFRNCWGTFSDKSFDSFNSHLVSLFFHKLKVETRRIIFSFDFLDRSDSAFFDRIHRLESLVFLFFQLDSSLSTHIFCHKSLLLDWISDWCWWLICKRRICH